MPTSTQNSQSDRTIELVSIAFFWLTLSILQTYGINLILNIVSASVVYGLLTFILLSDGHPKNAPVIRLEHLKNPLKYYLPPSAISLLLYAFNVNFWSCLFAGASFFVFTEAALHSRRRPLAKQKTVMGPSRLFKVSAVVEYIAPYLNLSSLYEFTQATNRTGEFSIALLGKLKNRFEIDQDASSFLTKKMTCEHDRHFLLQHCTFDLGPTIRRLSEELQGAGATFSLPSIPPSFQVDRTLDYTELNELRLFFSCLMPIANQTHEEAIYSYYIFMQHQLLTLLKTEISSLKRTAIAWSIKHKCVDINLISSCLKILSRNLSQEKTINMLGFILRQIQRHTPSEDFSQATLITINRLIGIILLEALLPVLTQDQIQTSEKALSWMCNRDITYKGIILGSSWVELRSCNAVIMPYILNLRRNIQIALQKYGGDAPAPLQSSVVETRKLVNKAFILDAACSSPRDARKSLLSFRSQLEHSFFKLPPKVSGDNQGLSTKPM